MQTQPEQTLHALGFSEIEALVYCFLLKNSPATGYKISRGISKAAANTYAAIEALAQRGALAVDEGETRLCRAVPPAQLCDALRAHFERDLSGARAQLQSISAPPRDEGVYRLETADQTFASARAMIKSARSVILADVFPEPLSRLATEFSAAMKRGVVVALELYDDPPTALRSAIAARSPIDAEDWPGQQLNIVADATQHLIALLDRPCLTLLQGVHSSSRYLACLQHSYLAASLYARAAKQSDKKALARIDALALLKARPPGLAQLFALHGVSNAKRT